MIPIGEDTHEPRRTPYVTWALFLSMAAIWLAYGSPDQVDAANEIKRAFGMSPARLFAEPLAAAPTLVTYAFLHGGFLHIAGNLLFLWVFGRGLEHEMRWRGFLLLFLACAIAAGLASAAFRMGSDVPTIGASGAISGIMGAYLILLPHTSIRAIVLVPWLLVMAVLRGERPIWDVPAWLAILTWFGLQIVEMISPAAFEANVDYWAHVGGFLTAYGAIRVLRAAFGFWPDDDTPGRLLDVPAKHKVKLPSSYVRAARLIPADTPIQREQLEAIRREGYIDPDSVPGNQVSRLIGRRLRGQRYRYEPILWEDLMPVAEPGEGEARAPRPV